jgi:biotin transport system substrate-specific component
MPNTASRLRVGSFASQDRSVAWQAGAIVLGTLFLALSSYVVVPMVPVPMTMQTFAVTLVGAVYGWRLGAATIVAWLVEGAIGFPVLAGGAGGLHSFVGPTAGYLFAFPVAGAFVGWLAERGWTGNRVVLALMAMLLGNAICLIFGAAWLSLIVGWERAIVLGVLPFLLGGVVKSALGAATLKALARTPVAA